MCDVVCCLLHLQFIHLTPLMTACDEGHTHTASLLIEAGADINYQDEVIYLHVQCGVVTLQLNFIL